MALLGTRLLRVLELLGGLGELLNGLVGILVDIALGYCRCAVGLEVLLEHGDLPFGCSLGCGVALGPGLGDAGQAGFAGSWNHRCCRCWCRCRCCLACCGRLGHLLGLGWVLRGRDLLVPLQRAESLLLFPLLRDLHLLGLGDGEDELSAQGDQRGVLVACEVEVLINTVGKIGVQLRLGGRDRVRVQVPGVLGENSVQELREGAHGYEVGCEWVRG